MLYNECMSSKAITGLVIVVLFIGGIVYYITNQPTDNYSVDTSAPIETVSTSSSTQQYSLTEVALHKTETDCWTAVSGKVYNLTPFVSQHPGGVENIIKLCGIEGTSAFMAQHGGQGRPEKELKSLFIGDLKQ